MWPQRGARHDPLTQALGHPGLLPRASSLPFPPAINLASVFLGLFFGGSALIFMLLAVWSRHYPDQQVRSRAWGVVGMDVDVGVLCVARGRCVG